MNATFRKSLGLAALCSAALAVSCKQPPPTAMVRLDFLPATASRVAGCVDGVKADCASSTLGQRFRKGLPAGATILFQNEYSPGFLTPPATAAAAQAGKEYRGLKYAALPNPLGSSTGTPADKEAWAQFVLPSGAGVVTGGESAIFDVMDVAASAKPGLTTQRQELRPMLAHFGLGPRVEYTLSAQAQQQGIEDGLGVILDSWPVRTALGPLTSYRGRASRFQRDGARCKLSYGVQLSSGLAARALRGAMAAALSAGTFAGWPLGSEYLSQWNVTRNDELVVAALDLTKAGCEEWEKRQ
ncbi:MAG: hypothetical protein IT162_05655 [Bryobacterales bacterium]|nr:hypothetical protein [Bryobacterales bacterium]